MKPGIVTRRPSIPTLWVDTSIALNLAASKDSRCAALKELVFDLVRRVKLLCPSADQHEEFEGSRLDEAAFGILEDLSLGICFRHREGILDSLIGSAMGAYVRDEPTIEITLSAYFHSDPVEELRTVNQQRVFASVDPFRNPEIRQSRQHAKRTGQAELEALRQRLVGQGQTYEKQFAVELEEYTEAFIIRPLRDLANEIQKGDDVIEILGPLKYLQMWKDIAGDPPGLPGLIRFFTSDHFAALPTIQITSQLWADLLTSRDRPIKASDGMDVALLAIAIPICHYVVTDKDMENRIKRRKIDRQWNTELFSLSSMEGLLERLRHLN